MSDWVNAELLKLKELYKRCGSYDTLRMDIAAVIRMLSGVAEMEQVQMFIYEQNILHRTMVIFLHDFEEQIGLVIGGAVTEMNEKKDLLVDIEQSVLMLSRFYTDMIDGTSNADRQRMSSLSVDTNIYELSPKFCEFYGTLLEMLLKVFEGRDKQLYGKYAFLIHPSIQNIAEAKLMFRKKEKPGKVTMIHVPVYMLEQLDIMPVYIFHEAYHVLTKKERNREARWAYYLKLMVAAIGQAAFHGVDLSGYDAVKMDTESHEKEFYNPETEDQLLGRWFFDLNKQVKSIISTDPGERYFYSDTLRVREEKYFNEKLKTILLNFPELVERFLLDKIRETDFADFKQDYMKMREGIKTIRENVIYMILNKSVERFSDLFLELFRECYADICCVLTIGITEGQYLAAFDKSIPVPVLDQRGDDFVKWVRIILVSSVIRDVRLYLNRKGENYYDDDLQSWDSDVEMDFRTAPAESDKHNVKIVFTQQMMLMMENYLKDCAKDFLKMINQDEGIREIRRVVREVMDPHRYQDEIHKILTGGSRAFFKGNEKNM